LKIGYLSSVADGTRDAVQAFAESVALDQPYTTRGLGRHRIETLRADLNAVADELSAELRESAKQSIKWPRFANGITDESRGVRCALTEFLYGRRVGKVDAVLRRYGYRIEEHVGLQPESLYLSVPVGELEKHLAELTARQRAADAARKADNRDGAGSKLERRAGIRSARNQERSRARR
jgi:hypothetical protein